MNIEQIAQIIYEINRAYCQSIDDNSFSTWNEAPEWQKATIRKGIEFHLASPDASPENSHESWLKEKEATGWKYGPVKDAEKKEHPCCVPYSRLPAAQRAKDYIFRQAVHSLMGHLTVQVPIPNPAERSITPGMVAMSADFNPGGREDVKQLKQIFADAYDAVDSWSDEAVLILETVAPGEIPPAKRIGSVRRWSAIAKTHLEEGQMAAVKAVTR